jgi:hypothetical protein
MHCDMAYKPRKIAIEMRVRFRLARWVIFSEKKPRELRGFFASSRCALESGLVPDFVTAERAG